MAAEGPKRLFQTKITDFQKAATNGGKDLDGVGTIRQEGDRFYRWIYNAHGSALVAGEPVCYGVEKGANMYEQVLQPTTSDLNTFAGIVMSAIPTLGWGWIQIEGYYASVVFSIGKTDILAGINAFPADTVDYVVGGDQQSISVVSTANQMAGRVQLAVSIASSSASAAGSDAKTTAVGGFIHCLAV